MADGSGVSGARYRAFISYSHRDAVFAARLHRRLESYVLPKRLGAGRRLTPIFKDREELPAAHDLSAQVRAALAASDCLIVVCSPDAAASPWVGREITLFRELHPERPVLAALVRGEPTVAFPPALAEDGVEPLAADFRKEADGDRLALLKLAAGVAGVGVDQLVQRDAQRRLRGVMAITAATFAGALVMGGMTVVALQARAEAERQRAEAEGLVNFMLTDLRESLKGVGSTDVMAVANRRALAYYSGQDLKRLPPASLLRRAKVLQAMGEDEEKRNDLSAASAQFDEAFRVTSVLLNAAPEDPERLFAHGQSVYWRGFVDFRQQRTVAARAAWEDYRRLALRLQRQQPKAVRSLRELAHAEGDLCTLALQQEKDLPRALISCLTSVKLMEQALQLAPDDRGIRKDLALRWAWLADGQVEAKDYPAGLDSRSRQLDLLDALLVADPRNAELLDNWATCRRGLSFIAYRRGRFAEALDHQRKSTAVFQRLAAIDPKNREWIDQVAYGAQVLPIIEAKERKRP